MRTTGYAYQHPFQTIDTPYQYIIKQRRASHRHRNSMGNQRMPSDSHAKAISTTEEPYRNHINITVRIMQEFPGGCNNLQELSVIPYNLRESAGMRNLQEFLHISAESCKLLTIPAHSCTRLQSPASSCSFLQEGILTSKGGPEAT